MEPSAPSDPGRTYKTASGSVVIIGGVTSSVICIVVGRELECLVIHSDNKPLDRSISPFSSTAVTVRAGNRSNEVTSA